MNVPTLGQFDDYRTGVIKTGGYSPSITREGSGYSTYREDPDLTPTIPNIPISPTTYISKLQQRLTSGGGARGFFSPIFPQQPGSITPKFSPADIPTDMLQIPGELRIAKEESNIGATILKWGLLGGGVIAAVVMLKG